MKGIVDYFRGKLREEQSVLRKPGQLKCQLAIAAGTLFFLLFSLPVTVRATNWALNSSSPAGMYADIEDMAVDTAGNVYMVGYFGSATLTFAGVTLSKIGSTDIFVVKLNSSGSLLWAKNYGGSGAVANGRAIAIDDSGNVYLSGDFYGASLTTPALTPNGMFEDTFVMKLNSSGSLIWAKNFGGIEFSGPTYCRDVAVDNLGNVYLIGDFGSDSLTTPALTKIGTRDVFVIKLDSEGNMVWAKNYGGDGANVGGFSIAVDVLGDVYIAGNFISASLTTPILTKISNSYDAFIIKLNSFGDTIWAKNYGSSGANTLARSIKVDLLGKVYLGGRFNGANLTTPALTKIGVEDAFVFMLDADGNTIWAKNFGGIGVSAQSFSIDVDGLGNVYVAGIFQSASLTTPELTKIGYRDAFAFKLDSEGSTNWARNYGGSGVTIDGESISVDGSGNVYLGGDFYGANLTTPALTLNGTRDIFVLKESAPVITSDGGGITASVNVEENQTYVTTITATYETGPLSFSITGGTDSDKFSIGSSSGIIAFNSAADYETPTDSDTNNIYELDVTVSDNGLIDIQTINVMVNDVDEIAPTTTAAPAGGTYTSVQSVTLSCDDGSGSGCNNIYYTTDGSTPTTSSFVYSSAINISTTTTLKFFARDAAGNQESIKTELYTIDTLAPVGSVTIDVGNVFVNSASVTLSLSASDINSSVTQMQISNDGTFDSEPWEAYSTSKGWTLTAGDGTKSVYVRFQDSVGNVSVSYSDSITLDTSTAPVDVSNLDATPNDDGSITLYWTASISNDINGYYVYRDAVKISSELINVTNYIDSNTINGTTYTYKVTSVGLTGKESSGASVEATSIVDINTPPAALDGLNIENTGTGDSLKVMWLPSSETDLSGYKVYWGTETGIYTGSFDVANLTSYTISDLTTGTLYYITVTAYDTDLNESEKSVEHTTTPELVATKPDPVTGLTVTEGNRYLTLDWNAVADISGYMIYIGESDGLYGVPVRTVDTTHTFENLQNGKTYYVAVSSYDLEPGHTYTASSVSDREASSGIPYDNDSPAIPGNLSATDAGTGGTVVLSWDRDDSFDIAGYVVTYKKTGDVVFEGVASNGISWSYAVTGLVDDVSYDFSAYAYDASGNFSEPVSVTETPTNSGSLFDIIPPEPPLLSAVPGDNKVTLLITAPADDDVDHYNIYIYNLAAGKFMPLSSVNGLIHEENIAVTNGRVFVFVATAVDTSGNESGYSDPVSAIPSELPGDIELEKDPPVLDRVDGYDIVEIAKGFGKEIGHPHFNPNTDLNGDGTIDGEDVTILAPNHGKKKGL